MTDIEQKLRSHLKSALGISLQPTQDDALLFSSGLIDSFSLVELIGYIEREFAIAVEPLDVNLDNFDSLGRMSAFVAQKRSEGA